MRQEMQSQAPFVGMSLWLRPSFSPFMATMMILLTLMCMPTGAAAQLRSNISEAVKELPPIDLFVYADQSSSVFKTLDGVRPADQLAQMIESAIESPLSPNNSRKVFDGRGKFYLYGFGQDSPVKNNEKANSCLNDIRIIADGLGVDRKEDIKAALNKYAANDPKFEATNFICLMRRIIENTQLAASAREGRQALVLIASDWLHDAFNKSNINDKSDNDLINKGIYQAGQGICQLMTGYATGKLPDGLFAEIEKVGDFSKDAAYPPLFAQLELKLKQGNFSTPGGEYAKCAIPISQDGLMAKITSAKMGAERFNFEDAAKFGSQFVERMVARIDPGLSVADAKINRISERNLELSVTVRNDGNFRADVQSVVLQLGGNPISLPVSTGSVDPGATLVIGPLTLSDAVTDAGRLPLMVLYTQNAGGTVRKTREKAWPVTRSVILTLTPQEVVLPPLDEGRFRLVITNTGSRDITLTRVAVGVSANAASDLSTGGGLLTAGAGVAQTIAIPQELRDAFSQGGLKAFVEAQWRNSSERDPVFYAETAVPKPTAPLALKVTDAKLAFKKPGDSNPILTMRINNPNSYDMDIAGVRFLRANNNLIGVLPLDKETKGGRLSAGQSAEYSYTADMLRSVGVYTEMIRQLGQQAEVRVDVESRGRGILPTSDHTAIRLEPELPLGIVCPEIGRPDSYNWTLPDGSAGELQLALRALSELPVPNIAAYEIRGRDLTLRSPPSWGPIKWTQGESGHQAADLRILFVDDETTDRDLRRLRYNTADNMTITLFYKSGDGSLKPICPKSFDLPADAEGEPKPLTADATSWRLVAPNGDDGGGDWFLEFRVINPSATSLQRLDKITLISGDASDSGKEVEFSILGRPGNTQEDHYISPDSQGVTVRIDLTRQGIDHTDIEGNKIRLMSGKDVISSRSTSIYTIKLPPNFIRITDAKWSTSQPALNLTVRAQGGASLKHLLLSGSAASSAGSIQSPDVKELPIAAGPLSLQAGIDIPISIPLSADMQKTDEGAKLLSKDNIYVCAPINNDKNCKNGWTRLPPLPSRNIRVERNDDKQTSATFDWQKGKLGFVAVNEGLYLDVVKSIRYKTTDGAEIVDTLEEPIPLRPGVFENKTVPISKRAQELILSSIDFEFWLMTRQNAADGSGKGKADPPVVRITSANDRRIDFVAAFFYRLASGIFGDMPSEPSPVTVATVEISRSVGALSDLRLQVGLSATADQKILSAKPDMDDLNKVDGGNENAKTAIRKIAIENSEKSKDNSYFFRAILDKRNSELSGAQSIIVKWTSSPTFINYCIYAVMASSLILLVYILSRRSGVMNYASGKSYAGVAFIGLFGMVITLIFQHLMANEGQVILYWAQKASDFFVMIFIASMLPGLNSRWERVSLTLYRFHEWLCRRDGNSTDITPAQEVARISDATASMMLAAIIVIGFIVVSYSISIFSTVDVCSPVFDIRYRQHGSCQ